LWDFLRARADTCPESRPLRLEKRCLSIAVRESGSALQPRRTGPLTLSPPAALAGRLFRPSCCQTPAVAWGPVQGSMIQRIGVGARFPRLRGMASADACAPRAMSSSSSRHAPDPSTRAGRWVMPRPLANEAQNEPTRGPRFAWGESWRRRNLSPVARNSPRCTMTRSEHPARSLGTCLA
jgi:hypothetical protein